MDISNNAMIVNLQIATWSAHKLDKGMSSKVTFDAGAAVDSARVNKHLVHKDTLKEIVTAAGAMRTHLYDKTLPWGDNGDRLLPRLAFTDFVEAHSHLMRQFEGAVETFITVKYPAARDQATARMGEMFKASDYPYPEEIRNRFSVNLDIHGVPTSQDFRVTMNEADMAMIRSQLDTKNQERLTCAVRDVWARLATVVGHFADKMGTDSVFRDSTVRNLEELVDALPAMNITGDPDLERIGQDIKDTLVGITPKDLREVSVVIT